MGRIRFSTVVVGLLVVVMITAVLGCAPKEVPATGQEILEGKLEPGDLTLLLPGDVPLELMLIPAGTFLMGRYPGEQDSKSEEDPQHSVTISEDFYMGKYE